MSPPRRTQKVVSAAAVRHALLEATGAKRVRPDVVRAVEQHLMAEFKRIAENARAARNHEVDGRAAQRLPHSPDLSMHHLSGPASFTKKNNNKNIKNFENACDQWSRAFDDQEVQRERDAPEVA